MDLSDTLEKDLARIIGFVNNCDSKASIVLGTVLTSVSLILGLSLSEFAGVFHSGDIGAAAIVILLLVVSAILLGKGLYALFDSLRARDDPLKNESLKGTIFYRHIASMDLDAYRERITARNDENYVRELTEQIRANAVICTEKYDRYNEGLKLSVRGVVLLIFVAVLAFIF